jgi:hypothetical protein
MIILPLQLGLFGTSLFSTNPPAWQLQPLPFWLLAGLEMIAVIWSMALLPMAFAVHGLPYPKAFFMLFVVWGFLVCVIVGSAMTLTAIV